MKGHRAYPNAKGELWLSPREYGKDPQGVWWARCPGCSMGCLKNHEVEEHLDGTITVTPSIEVTQPPLPGWHGFLERGIWRTA